MVTRMVDGFEDGEPCADWIRSLINESKKYPYRSYSLNTSAVGASICKCSRFEQAKLAIAILRWYLQYQETLQPAGSYGTITPRDAACILEAMLQIIVRKLPFSAHGSLIFERGGHIGLESMNEAACSHYDRTS